MFDYTMLLVAALIVLGLITATLVARLYWRRLAEVTAALRLEQESRAQLERQVDALLACSREIGEQVREQTRRQRSIVEQLNRLDHHSGDDAAIGQAGKLLEKGVSLNEISDLCDLSQGELELLARLSPTRQAA